MSKNEIDATIRVARNLCTVKQARFTEEVFKSIPASTAYRNAGYTASTAGTAEASASKLLRNAKVSAYLSALRDAETGSAILSRRERLELLTSNARASFKEKERPSVVASVRELNKMTNEYKAKTVNVNGNVTLFEAITGKRRRSL